MSAVAREQRGEEALYAKQPVLEELEDHDVTRALRRNARNFIRSPAGDLRISTTGLVGLVNLNGKVCQFNADLPVLVRFLG